MIPTLILTLTLTAAVAARIAVQVAFRRYASKQSPAVQARLAQIEPSGHF